MACAEVCVRVCLRPVPLPSHALRGAPGAFPGVMALWEGCVWQVTAGPVSFFLLSRHSSGRQAVVAAAPLSHTEG